MKFAKYMGDWGKSYKKGSLEEALLLDSKKNKGDEKHSIERLGSVILGFKESRYLQANLGNFLM